MIHQYMGSLSATLLGLSALSATGCGPQGTPGATQTSSAALTVEGCPDGALLAHNHQFRYIGASVTRHLCKPVGAEAPTVVSIDDTTGGAVDFAALAKADAHAFHLSHSSMEPEVRYALEVSGQPEDVYIWFYVDEYDRPEKEALTLDAEMAETANDTHEARMRTAAASLVGKLAAVPGVDEISKVDGGIVYGIPVVRLRAGLAQLDAIGTWPEVWRIDPVPKKEDLTPLAETYYYTTVESVIDGLYGADGSGVTVAIYEGFIPDSFANLPGAPAGNCDDDWGNFRHCHCANSDLGDHSRLTMGVVRRSTGTMGMANSATTIMANHSGSCTSYGNDNYASALNWATYNNARVINHSACTGTAQWPNAHDVFFDYKASNWPWPTVVPGAGNDPTLRVCNKARNGLVVGGALESGTSSNRSLVTFDSGKSWKNGVAELPHVVAISENVTTAAYVPGYTQVTGGTSAAAPQVAGMVASVMELNASLQVWPEVVQPGVMVSADADVDGVPLNLHDGNDHKDGAGLVNALRTSQVLATSAKVDGGNGAARVGHDYGSLTAYFTPAQAFYSEAYVANVPAGATLRAAVHVQTRPTCPQNPGSWDCGPNPYPYIGLFVYDGANLIRASSNTLNNYQYVAHVNSTGVNKNYTLKIYVYAWNGLSGTTYGLAWNSW